MNSEILNSVNSHAKILLEFYDGLSDSQKKQFFQEENRENFDA